MMGSNIKIKTVGCSVSGIVSSGASLMEALEISPTLAKLLQEKA